MTTSFGSSVPPATIFSTCTMTLPPEFRQAWAMAVRSVGPISRCAVQLPYSSAQLARRKTAFTGKQR